MYIEPNSTVKLLRGIPLDKDYRHSVLFATPTAQRNTIGAAKYTKFTLTNQMYRRWSDGVIKVMLTKAQVDDCNYLMYQNTSYSNKWFYAFIDKVEYCSSACTYVYFTIDKLMTYWFDFTMGMCFVEREHTETDLIGEHTLSEGFDISQYVLNLSVLGVDTSQLCYMLFSTVDLVDFYSHLPGGFTPAESRVFDVSGIMQGYGVYATKNKKLVEILLYELNKRGLQESIQSIFMFPLSFVADTIPYHPWQDTPPDSDIVQLSDTDYLHLANRSVVTLEQSIEDLELDGYAPKNNKCFIAPYSTLTVTDNIGHNQSFRPELFKNGKVKFQCECAITPNPKIMVIPLNYRNADADYDSAFTCSNCFPLCTWKGGGYNEWFAQNQAQIQGQIGVDSAIALVSFADPVGGITELAGFSAIRNSVNTGLQVLDKLHTSTEEVRGNTNNGNIRMSLRDNWAQDIMVKYYTVKREQAKIIDDYFSFFGYKVDTVKIPNVKNPNSVRRPCWNYVKTNGCSIHPVESNGVITSCVPAEIEKDITTIFDNGITFWEELDKIGDYTQDNSPIA